MPRRLAQLLFLLMLSNQMNTFQRSSSHGWTTILKLSQCNACDTTNLICQHRPTLLEIHWLDLSNPLCVAGFQPLCKFSVNFLSQATVGGSEIQPRKDQVTSYCHENLDLSMFETGKCSNLKEGWLWPLATSIKSARFTKCSTRLQKISKTSTLDV